MLIFIDGAHTEKSSGCLSYMFGKGPKALPDHLGMLIVNFV